MMVSGFPLRSVLHALVVLSLAASLPACGKKEDSTAKGQPAAASSAPADAKPEPAPAAQPAVSTLAERDVSTEARQWIPGFTGRLVVLAPADAQVTQSVGGLDVRGEGFGLSVVVGAYRAAELKTHIEAGDTPVDNARIVESGEGFVLYEGDVFGEHGFFVHADLPALGGLVAACSTPMAQGYPRAQAEKILEACRAIKVE
jgi:hypothetical protein